MTQEAFNTARDMLKEALEVIASGFYREAEGEANPQSILTLIGMATQTTKASVALQEGDARAAAYHLDWMTEDDGDDVQARIAAMEAYSERVCSCDECAAKRGEIRA
jgi:exopolyphosphatase/pppGpp-phosphohydrolase